MRTPRTTAGALALLVALGAVLSGCGGGDADQQAPDPATVLAAAKRNLDATSGVRIGLSTAQLPAGVSGLLAADGVGTHPPAFSGDIKVSAGGVTADAAVVAVDDKVFAKLPFTSRFAPIDPADYSAPDPAALLKPEGGLSALLTSARKVQKGKRVRDGKVVVTSYTADVPGRAVARVIPSADAKATFAGTFTVTDDDRLTRAVLSGPFYPEADSVTYTITFADYGTTKNIKAP